MSRTDPDPKKEQASELFYVNENGDMADEALHEQMFTDGAEEIDSAEVHQRMLDEGMDPELAESLYG